MSSRSGGTSAICRPISDLPLRVLYQDDEMLIVDKPGLLPCHPLHAGETQTLMNAVVARFPQAATAGTKPLEGGLVHRLDNGTSGAIMVALTPAAFARLRAALRNKQIVRSYLALVEGDLKRAFQFDSPIAHHPRNQRKMMAVNDPRMAAKLKARPAIDRGQANSQGRPFYSDRSPAAHWQPSSDPRPSGRRRLPSGG